MPRGIGTLRQSFALGCNLCKAFAPIWLMSAVCVQPFVRQLHALKPSNLQHGVTALATSVKHESTEEVFGPPQHLARETVTASVAKSGDKLKWDYIAVGTTVAIALPFTGCVAIRALFTLESMLARVHHLLNPATPGTLDGEGATKEWVAAGIHVHVVAQEEDPAVAAGASDGEERTILPRLIVARVVERPR